LHKPLLQELPSLVGGRRETGGRHTSGVGVGGWLGDAEDGPEPAGCGDGDVVDEGFDESFALVVRSVGDDLGDVSGYFGEGGGVGLGGFGVDLGGELLAAARSLCSAFLRCSPRTSTRGWNP
jgi:hypothetical protein